MYHTPGQCTTILASAPQSWSVHKVLTRALLSWPVHHSPDQWTKILVRALWSLSVLQSWPVHCGPDQCTTVWLVHRGAIQYIAALASAQRDPVQWTAALTCILQPRHYIVVFDSRYCQWHCCPAQRTDVLPCCDMDLHFLDDAVVAYSWCSLTRWLSHSVAYGSGYSLTKWTITGV